MLVVLLAQPAVSRALPSRLANVRAGELVVKLRPGTVLSPAARAEGPDVKALNTLLQQAGAGIARSLGPGSATYQIRLHEDTDLAALAQRLAALPNVAFAEPNRIRTATRTSADPLLERQWALGNIRAYDAWDLTTGTAVPIAILDTGASPTHADLKDKLLPGFDFFNGDDDPRDDDGHGTYTAGVAAAIGDNGVGVAGICWGCPIMPVKVLNRRGQGDDATIAAGMRWAVENGARIISMSLGGPEDTQVLREAITFARERNVLVVAASGNGQADGNRPNYPAAYPSVLAVSATGANDSVTSFSTTGSFVDIAAPGAGVVGLLWDQAAGDTYGVASGTSAACPHVAGAAALVLSVRPELTADQLAEVLMAAADDQGAPGRDPEYGYGRLNILRAVQLASDPNVLTQSRIEGTVSGVQADQVVVTLSNGLSIRPDPSGFFRFENLPAGTYIVNASGPGLSPPAQQVTLTGTALSVATVNFNPAPEIARVFAPVAPPQDGSLFFPQTGHTLRGAFREYWEAHGGLPIFGYPTSEEFTTQSDDGQMRLVQFFERHRLEFHPESPAPYNVQLSRLGDTILQQQGRNWFDFPGGRPVEGCLYFEGTNHSLCEPFLSYWRSSGLEFDGSPGKSAAESLALFGQPLSEPVLETGPDGAPVLVQWFERARFEDHGSNGVLLGLLGNELARARGWK